MRILITGASGCVGRYIVDDLLNKSGHDLVLLLRDPSKLPLPDGLQSRVKMVECDLRDAADQQSALQGVDVAILLATAWGGDETFDVTVSANVALAEKLMALGCKRIIYFATASVLTKSGDPLADARDLGTEYIRAKYALVEEFEKRAGSARMIGLFPTLVLGGRIKPPYMPLSHFAGLLKQVAPWMWAGRFFTAPGRFHFIHARDVAVMVRFLSEREETDPAGSERIVLGNPAKAVDQLLRDFCRHTGQSVRPLISLSPRLAAFLIRILRIQLSPWDKYCMDNPDQSYFEAKNPTSYGLDCYAPELSDALDDIGIIQRK